MIARGPFFRPTKRCEYTGAHVRKFAIRCLKSMYRKIMGKDSISTQELFRMMRIHM